MGRQDRTCPNPTALRRFNLVPVGLNPKPERGERLLEGPAEIGEHVEVCCVHPNRIERPFDETGPLMRGCSA